VRKYKATTRACEEVWKGVCPAGCSGDFLLDLHDQKRQAASHIKVILRIKQRNGCDAKTLRGVVSALGWAYQQRFPDEPKGENPIRMQSVRDFLSGARNVSGSKVAKGAGSRSSSAAGS
jgi:hypothetical protein